MKKTNEKNLSTNIPEKSKAVVYARVGTKEQGIPTAKKDDPEQEANTKVASTTPAKKRIASYSRVATREQATPLMGLYEKYIASHPDWEPAGIYIDEGFSGTKDDRPDFQRLLADCRAGKIDLLMTKSTPYATPLNPRHNKEP